MMMMMMMMTIILHYKVYTQCITFFGSLQIDRVSPTLSLSLDCLEELFKNGVGVCGINTARSFLSCIIIPLVLILQFKQGSLKGFLNQNPLHHDMRNHGTLARYFNMTTLGKYITRRIYHYGT